MKKKTLKEALGVPENITQVSEKITKEFIKLIPNNSSFDELNNEKFIIGINDNISDMKIKDVIIEIELFEHDTLIFVGMAFIIPRALGKDLKLYSKNEEGLINLSISIASPKESTGKDVKKFLNDNFNQVNSSFAHELKHAYDNYKNPKTSIPKLSKYSISANSSTDIDGIKKFLFYMYFANDVESLVRPSEFASDLKSNEINAEKFYEFFTNSETYKKFQTLKKYNLNTLYYSLYSQIDTIKEIIKNLNIEIPNNNKEIIDEFLKIVYISLLNEQMGKMEKMLITSMFEQILGLPPEKVDFLNKNLRNLSKYEKNPLKFFENEIKFINFVGDKMIKKLAKLYSMINNNENLKTESIHDFELHQKFLGEKLVYSKKIMDEYKTNKPLKRKN
jgi:hypothetical protein